MDIFNRENSVASPKLQRPENGGKRSKSRQSTVWFLPIPIFGTMGFFFIIFGIIVISTSKSGASKVTVTTGVILLVSGGVMWGLCFFFICSSPNSCVSSETTVDNSVSITFPREAQSTFDIIPPSAPAMEEDFYQLSPATSRRDSFYPLVNHGQGQQCPYPYGRFVPTAPEVPLYPCWIPQAGVPGLPHMSPESEAVIRLAILNNPQIPLSLILGSGLTVQPRVSI